MKRILHCVAVGGTAAPRRHARPRVFVLIIVLAFAGWMVHRGNDLMVVATAVAVLGATAGDVVRRVLGGDSTSDPVDLPTGPPATAPVTPGPSRPVSGS